LSTKQINLSNFKPHILFIAAEADPFIKVGGLGDVAGSLPRALKQLLPEMDIRLAIPFYDALHQKNIPVQKVVSYTIPTIDGDIKADLYETKIDQIPVYLIDGKPVRDSKPVYGADCEKDAEKFIFFSLACLYLPQHINWSIDILHANDWHTAVALYVLAQKKNQLPGYSKVRSLLTLHNLPFMGAGSQNAIHKFLISPAKNPRMPSWARTLPLPMGINAADKTVAVSPTYAKEILTPEYSCDLEKFLQSKQKKLCGILNGIDYQIWDPLTDTHLQVNYSNESLIQRIENKKSLQIEFSLNPDVSIPLFVSIGRMDRQKGIDLILAALPKLKNKKWQAIFLGTGDKTLEAQVANLQEDFPEQVRTAFRFDSALSHRLYAGGDMLLMPSRYEPCGLAQIIAMRYGCVPIARATGGLVDTILNYTESDKLSTGFLFSGNSPIDFAHIIDKAIKVFSDPLKWELIQQNDMKQDFSWQISAKKYAELYFSII
jgi:starch synthase